MKKIYFLLALLPLFASCEKENPALADYTVQVGEEFKIELEANLSTGYHWSWMNRESVTISDTVDFEYVIDDPGLEGSGGTEIWTFLATSTGMDTLKFVYLAPGSTGNEGDLTEEFSVLVN